MNRGVLFWFLMIIVLLFGLWLGWPAAYGVYSFGPLGFNLLLWVLLALLGWQVFGAPIH